MVAHGRRAAALFAALLLAAAVAGVSAREANSEEQELNGERHARRTPRPARLAGYDALSRTKTPEQQLEFERAVAKLTARRVARTGGSRADPGPPYSVNNFTCPTTVIHVNNTGAAGTDLGAFIQTTGSDKTYVLAPGVYTTKTTVSFSGPGGLCVIGTGDTPDDVSIRADLTSTASFTRMFRALCTVSTVRSTGFKNLAAFGAGTAKAWTLIEAQGTNTFTCASNVYAESIVASNFTWTDGTVVFIGARPSAVTVNPLGYFKDSIFADNIGTDSGHAGALDFAGESKGLVDNCLFWRNRADQEGGAIYVHDGCTLDISDSQFLHNTAFISPASDGGAGRGGAIFVDGTVTINGDLCAQQNTAYDSTPNTGGFAFVDSGGILVFNTPDNQTVAANTPDDVYLASGGSVTSASYGAWSTKPSSYTMLATVGQCSANFTTGATTCYACSLADWSAPTCSCKAPPPTVDIGLAVVPSPATAGDALTFSLTMSNSGATASPPTNGFTLELTACITVPDTLTPTPTPGSPAVTCTACEALTADAATTVTCTSNETMPAGADWAWNLEHFTAACNATATAALAQPSAGATSTTAQITINAITCSEGKCCNTDGSFKSNETVCRQGSCIQDTYCTGSTPDCPMAINQPDGQECSWVQPNLSTWVQQQSAQRASVAAVGSGSTVRGSADVTLAFVATHEGSVSTSAYGDDGDDVYLAGLRPCLGHCVAGGCQLVFPFEHPAGGCCRVDRIGKVASRHLYHRRHRYHRRHYDEDSFTDIVRPGKLLTTKVCWEEVDGHTRHERSYSDDSYSDDAYERN